MRTYTRVEILTMKRKDMLAFFDAEPPAWATPSVQVQKALEQAGNETLRQLILQQLEAEGRLKG